MAHRQGWRAHTGGGHDASVVVITGRDNGAHQWQEQALGHRRAAWLARAYTKEISRSEAIARANVDRRGSQSDNLAAARDHSGRICLNVSRSAADVNVERR
ncbi:MAG TPA: hypothetical protein VI485_20975 [Vicinamibacterales bacterium]|nr:hypothetical protein [Vicinamibacterales bacterium]